VNGKVDLEIIDKTGNIHTLETLEQGDNIGQYTTHYSNDLVFRIIVRSQTARILTLDKKFFDDFAYTWKIEGFKQALPLLLMY